MQANKPPKNIKKADPFAMADAIDARLAAAPAPFTTAQPAATQPAAEQSSAAQPVAERRVTVQPVVEQHSTAQHAAEQSSAARDNTAQGVAAHDNATRDNATRAELPQVTHGSKVRVTAYLRPEQAAAVHELAKSLERSESYITSMLITEALKARGK